MKPALNDEEKRQIETLAAGGWSPYRIGKRLGRSHHTIRKFLDRPETRAAVQDEKAVLATKYREMARKVLDSISDEDLLAASLQQKAVASGIFLDKSLVLTGDVPSLDIHVLLEAVAAVKLMRDQERPPHLPPAIETEQ